VFLEAELAENATYVEGNNPTPLCRSAQNTVFFRVNPKDNRCRLQQYCYYRLGQDGPEAGMSRSSCKFWAGDAYKRVSEGFTLWYPVVHRYNSDVRGVGDVPSSGRPHRAQAPCSTLA
jgi:hypothetical protein